MSGRLNWIFSPWYVNVLHAGIFFPPNFIWRSIQPPVSHGTAQAELEPLKRDQGLS